MVSLQQLQDKHKNEHQNNEHLANLIARLQLDVDFFQEDIEELKNTNDTALNNFRLIYLDLLEHQRKLLHKMNHLSEFDDELIRKYNSLIDMEEFKLRQKLS